MTSDKKNITASFNPTLLPAIFITIVTWFPFLSVAIPVFWHGEVSEISLGVGTRYDLSPQAYFVIMTVCSLLFFLASFLPMCLSFMRGYHVKFGESSLYFKRQKVEISEIEKIESSKVLVQNYRFIMKSGQSFIVSTLLNGNISKYVEGRFYKIITS